MEKFEHKEYRDQLAKDLKNIPEHEERRDALHSEENSFRYVEAKERHVDDMNSFRESVKFKKAQEKIKEELHNLSLSDLIESHPELENLEAIPVNREGREMSIFRVKDSPEVGLLIWSKSKHQGGTQGRVRVQMSEPRLEKEKITLEYRSICGCCAPEFYDVEERFIENKPEYPENDNRDYSIIREELDEKLIEWQSSEEGKQNAEWRKEQKDKFRDLIQKYCEENNIKVLAVRKASNWIKNYGTIDGIEVIEVTDSEEVYERMGEDYSSPNRFTNKKTKNFEIRS